MDLACKVYDELVKFKASEVTSLFMQVCVATVQPDRNLLNNGEDQSAHVKQKAALDLRVE